MSGKILLISSEIPSTAVLLLLLRHQSNIFKNHKHELNNSKRSENMSIIYKSIGKMSILVNPYKPGVLFMGHRQTEYT